MKPAPFTYHAPTSVADVVGLLAGHGDRARLLAGGQALMPLMARRIMRVRQLIDLNRVSELSSVTQRGSWLRIGAMTRLRTLEKDPAVRMLVPLLVRASVLAGPVQVRNRATIGGALAYADPAAELPAVAVALDARIELRGEQIRQVPAAEFFLGAHRTAKEDAELLTAVEFPVGPTHKACAIEEIAPRSVGLALAGAVVSADRLVLFGVAERPVRPAAAETVLARGCTAQEVAVAAIEGLEPPDTPEIRGANRRALARAAVERAVATVRNEAAHA